MFAYCAENKILMFFFDQKMEKNYSAYYCFLTKYVLHQISLLLGLEHEQTFYPVYKVPFSFLSRAQNFCLVSCFLHSMLPLCFLPSIKGFCFCTVYKLYCFCFLQKSNTLSISTNILKLKCIY